MKVFFTCSTSRFLENYDCYRTLCQHIKKLGHELTDDWLDEAYRNIQNKISGDSNNVYERKVRAINQSDVIIAEASIKSFTVGHQITLGLNKTIPTLLLFKCKNKKQKMPYIEGIKSSWLTKKSYKTKEEAFQIIENYLHLYSSKRKTYSFNLVINQEENLCLEKRMLKLGKTKTEIIRNLIQEAIQREVK